MHLYRTLTWTGVVTLKLDSSIVMNIGVSSALFDFIAVSEASSITNSSAIKWYRETSALKSSRRRPSGFDHKQTHLTKNTLYHLYRM